MSIFKKNKKTTPKLPSVELRREMCEKILASGTCPKCCEICAWDVTRTEEHCN